MLKVKFAHELLQPLLFSTTMTPNAPPVGLTAKNESNGVLTQTQIKVFGQRWTTEYKVNGPTSSAPPDRWRTLPGDYLMKIGSV